MTSFDRPLHIGGPRGSPRKVRPLFRTQYGYFTGTNDVYMGTNVHICIQIVPPELTGGFMGAMPPESTLPPMCQRLTGKSVLPLGF